MGKFGKKVVVDADISKYIIGVVAQSGFGKSTLMKNVAEKKYGEEGYICLDFGQEDGYSAIEGAIVEKCPTWKHFMDVVDDIVENKETEYPNLKVVVADTLDAAFECAEKYAIDSYNKEHILEQNFKKATSINSVDGGFGNGLTRCVNIVKAAIKRLREAGVGFWYTAHCKERDMTDLYTGRTYTMLTASLTNRYFGSIQNISHIIGFGYFDREVEHVEVGAENPVTKKKKSRETVTTERRVVRFHDTDYVCAAKSRFSGIPDEIELSADTFISAIEGAISASGGVADCFGGVKLAPVKPKATKTAPKPVEEKPAEAPASADEAPFEPDGEDKTTRIAKIKTNFSDADTDVKKKIKALLIEGGDGTGKLNESIPDDVLTEIENILDII